MAEVFQSRQKHFSYKRCDLLSHKCIFVFFIKGAHTVEAKEKQTREMAGKAIQELKRDLHLLRGVDESIIKALAGKLTFAVKKTVKGIIDGEQPNEETVKKLIDMKKLAFKHSEVERTEESRQKYAAAVLRTCEHARSTLT